MPPLDGTARKVGRVAAPSGIWRASYKEILHSIVDGGFNAVRIPWTDVGLDVPLNGYSDKLGWINTTLNWDLVADPAPDSNGRYKYVSTLEAFDAIVAYAKQIGLKVI